MKIRETIVITALLVACGAYAWAMDREELELDHALTMEVKSPHTRWAKPYARGRTRVLVFINGRGTLPRECVELMERFDFAVKAVFWTRIVDSTRTHWHGGELGEQRMLKLLEQPWDCFVLYQIGMDKMSARQQYKLLAPVVAGKAGIVALGLDDRRIFKPERKLKQVPAILGKRKISLAFRIGQGRGVRMDKRPDIPYSETWARDYDYWSEKLGTAILWAAGREPGAGLQLSLPANTVERSAHAKLAVTFSGKLAGSNPRLRLRLRPGAGPCIDLSSRFKEFSQFAAISLPELTAGQWRAEAWVATDRGIETWSTLAFDVSARYSIKSLVLEREWGEVGGQIAGRVLVNGNLPEDSMLVVRLMDTRRRVLARQEFAASAIKGNAARFSFTITGWMPMLVTVEAGVRLAAKAICSDYRYFRVTKRRRGHFNFLIWDTPRGALAPLAERELARNTVTLQLGQSGSPPLCVAANNIAWVPYTTRIMAKLDPKKILQPFCWNDEDAFKKHADKKLKKYEQAREHGVFVYSLGDEVDTKGCCLSPHCARAYRGYLQDEYKTLEALNRSWGTKFAKWEEVGLAQAGDVEEAASLKAKNYPRWFDRQAFKSWNFAQFCKKYVAAYHRLDPRARTGFEGAGRFEKGDDIDLIARSVEFWSPYPGTADEVIRSIVPRDFPRSNWIGYTKDADSLLAKYWRAVTRGSDSVWWWRWDCIGKFRGWLAPDLRPFAAVKDIIRDTQIMRDGLGDLLLRSSMTDSRIALLYSYPSTLIYRFENGVTYGGCESAHKSALRLIRELGLQFRYVTDRMLRLGEFKAAHYRVLMLVRAEAMGAKEAEVIRDFVRAGGTVIADVRPGIFTGHCKLRRTGILDELFGIARSKTAPARAVAFGEWKNLKADPGIKLTTGKAEHEVNGIPLFISNTFGKGRTLLLNFDLSSYPGLDMDETGPEPENRARAMFEQANVKPWVLLRNPQGRRERNVEVICWQNGEIRIMSLFRQKGERSEVRVELDRNYCVYDLRSRRSLGMVRSFGSTIIPCRASFFVLAPRRDSMTALWVASRNPVRGSVLNASIAIPGASGLHALRIRVNAGGRELPWLSQNVIVGERPVNFELPIAYNDPAGVYEVRATDLFSGKVVSAKVMVK